MNKNYEKGVRYERKIVNAARAAGLIAFRSAGSHSPVDVVIIDPKKRLVSFIQAKKGKSTMTKAQKREFEAMTTVYSVRFIIKDGKTTET
jgi:Holliday junction resolvase